MIEDPDLIAFAGDWHGNTPWMKEALRTAASSGAKVVIQTGDFGYKFTRNYMHALRHTLVELDQHLYFVDGNHDEHPALFKWYVDEDGFGRPPQGQTGVDRVHYIPRGHRFKFWGKTFLGLGGAVSVDKQWRTPYHTWWPEEAITQADVYRAIGDGSKVDVMICHDLTDSADLPNLRKSEGWPESELRASKINREAIQSVVDVVQPDLFVHGHFHVYYDQMVGSMHVVSLDRDTMGMHRNLYVIDSDLNRHDLVSPQDPASKKLQAAREKAIAAAEIDDNF